MEKDFTFYSAVDDSYSRIHLFLVDEYLLHRVTKMSIHNITWPDHTPITIDIADSHKGSNTVLWGNNTYLLSNPNHRIALESKLKEYFTLNKDEDSSSASVWSLIRRL